MTFPIWFVVLTAGWWILPELSGIAHPYYNPWVLSGYALTLWVAALRYNKSFFAALIPFCVFWALLSGHFDIVHNTLGAISCVGAAALFHKSMFESNEMNRIPGLTLKFLGYLGWLGWQIVLSNIDVLKRVLSPSMPINPQIIRFNTNLKTDIGKTVLANSITLTPGTVTIGVEGSEFIVHAIADGPADGLLKSDDMQKRAAQFEF